jgi:hypothetical protein
MYEQKTDLAASPFFELTIAELLGIYKNLIYIYVKY